MRTFQCWQCPDDQPVVFEIDESIHHALGKWDKVIEHLNDKHPTWVDDDTSRPTQESPSQAGA